MKVRCIDCAYVAMTPAPDQSLVKMCHYNPPTPVSIIQVGPMGPVSQIVSVWPAVNDDGTCAHGELKLEIPGG